jgi:signal transduction histidine kinase
MRTMAERVQSLEVVSQQHAKLMALGTLSAGLAHEINNPAAAGRRAAGQLNEAFQALQSQSLLLSQCSLSREQRGYLESLQRDMMTRPSALALDMLEQSEREDALSEWLDRHGIQESWNLAPTLISVGWKEAQLNELASRVPETALAAALPWLAASLTVGEKASAIDQSLTRITDLVQAVKTYSFMDQAPMQEVDIHEGLDSTLTMLHHKLKQRSVTVIREYDPRLPRVCAYGSELNQVWTNLIDNAIDALESGGQITLRTTCENDMVLVQVRDNGPGIPTGVLAHIFDPFFTTKEVGKGTGLGLDICYRIVVNKHKGDIRVDSRPGDTCFEVRLPVAAGQPPPRK